MDSDKAQVVAALAESKGGKVHLNDLADVVAVGEVGPSIAPLIDAGFVVFVHANGEAFIQATEDWK
jgi:hypothetical protein